MQPKQQTKVNMAVVHNLPAVHTALAHTPGNQLQITGAAGTHSLPGWGRNKTTQRNSVHLIHPRASVDT